VHSEYSINEGGGDRVDFDGRILYLCAAARLVERLGDLAVDPRLEPETEAFLHALLDGEMPDASAALAAARAVDPGAGELLEPLLGMTIAPTMIAASEKRNVIPAVCDVTIDCRLLPGQTPEEAAAAIRRRLGDGDYELENIERHGGTRSPIGGPLWEAVTSFVVAEEPGARVAPICVAGFADSPGCAMRSGASRTASSPRVRSTRPPLRA
jgi:acetylornithine deacetylase/succinyl-diaminopimelate desuccinylase-like protein